jgi:hypothetical protein
MSGRASGRAERAGHSANPLVKKLGIEDGDLVVLVDAPSGWSVPALPVGVRLRRRRGGVRPGDDQASVTVAFVRNAARLEQVGSVLADRIADTSSLWIAWPRRAGGHESDVTDQLLREVLLPTGLVDVKVAALDDDWSGLKFVVRRERRTSGSARAGSPRVRRGASGGR